MQQCHLGLATLLSENWSVVTPSGRFHAFPSWREGRVLFTVVRGNPTVKSPGGGSQQGARHQGVRYSAWWEIHCGDPLANGCRAVTTIREG